MTRRSEPDDDHRLGALLKAEADRYQPDHDRIRRRIREGRAASRDTRFAGRPEALTNGRFFRPRLFGSSRLLGSSRSFGTSRSFGSSGRGRRATWLLPTAVAGLVGLIAGTAAALDRYDDRGHPSRSVRVATPTPTTAPSPAVPSSAPGSAAPAPSFSQPATSSTRSAPPGDPDLQVSLRVAPAGTTVSLPGGAKDWIVAGSQVDGGTVRPQHGDQLISGPHLTGNPTAISMPGPFRRSWTGGMPAATGTGATNWLTVTGPPGGPETGLLVKAPASRQPAELVLYLGAEGADGRLQAQVTDSTTQPEQSPPAATPLRLKGRSDGRGYIVTIQFRADSADGTLSVQLISGSGGSVALAAATLR